MVSSWYSFFSSRRRHTRWPRDWSSDVCSSDLNSAQHGPITGCGSHRSYPHQGGLSASCRGRLPNLHQPAHFPFRGLPCTKRSEERRVGKECRTRVWRVAVQKKNAASLRELTISHVVSV